MPNNNGAKDLRETVFGQLQDLVDNILNHKKNYGRF